MDSPWISTAEGARRLAVTPRTVYGFIDRGELPAYRMGRVIRVRVVDLEAFIESCRIEPGSLRLR
jgi:excisionase family DNA binding protein